MDKSLDLKNKFIKTDPNKALDVVTIDLEGKSSIADYMIIASGTSSRHIQALSEQVVEELKKMEYLIVRLKEIPQIGNWLMV